MTDEEQAWIVNAWVLGHSQRSIAFSLGHSQSSIVCTVIKNFCIEHAGYDVQERLVYNDERKSIARVGLIQFMASGGKLKQPILYKPAPAKVAFTFSNYQLARREHAWQLRAEQVSWKDIGDRLSVGRQQAAGMAWHFAQRFGRAVRRARWRWST